MHFKIRIRFLFNLIFVIVQSIMKYVTVQPIQERQTEHTRRGECLSLQPLKGVALLHQRKIRNSKHGGR